MTREDWLLMTLAAAQGKGLTPVQLQKSLFLLGKGLDSYVGQRFYEFFPYNYGPFDGHIYRDADKLAEHGLVEKRADGRRWPQYYITSDGMKRSEEIWKRFQPAVKDYVNSIVRWTQNLSFPALVRAIYQKYPEYRVNSIFQG